MVLLYWFFFKTQTIMTRKTKYNLTLIDTSYIISENRILKKALLLRSRKPYFRRQKIKWSSIQGGVGVKVQNTS